MFDVLPIYTIPIVFAILVSVFFLLGLGFTLVYPRILVYAYLSILFFISESSFGSLEISKLSSIYGKGSGVLYFSVILWFILFALLWSKLSARFANFKAHRSNILLWFWGWFFLLVLHAGVAFCLDVPIRDALSPAGFSNMVWTGVLIALVLTAFRNENHLIEFMNFIVFSGLVRAIFGLVRWAALGGDPANVYANFDKINIKLTFFDINDSLLCCLAFTISIIRLFSNSSENAAKLRLIYWITAISTSLCVLLSFRRTAWLGFLLAIIIILAQLPKNKRAKIAFMTMPIALASIVYMAWARLSQTKGASGIGGFFYDLQSRSVGKESVRLLELKLVLADFIAHPLVGIGSWGRYYGYQLISWQRGEDAGKFLHSGVLHIALKSGVVGLILFFGLIFSFVKFTRTSLKDLCEQELALAIAGAAGLAFMLPDVILGTPIPQVRTMQMLGVCFSLPYLAYGIKLLGKSNSLNLKIEKRA